MGIDGPGIPYISLLPMEYDNLIVASLGASFSRIETSSCRLSRIMMTVGEVTGVASVLELTQGAGSRVVALENGLQRNGVPAFIEKQNMLRRIM